MSGWVRFVGPAVLGALVWGLVVADFVGTLIFGVVLPTHSHALIAIGLSGLAILVMHPHGWRAAACSGLAMLVLIGGLYYWPMTPRKQFVRSVHEVQLGMSHSQVASIFADFRNGHPYGGHAPFLESDDPNKELWHHGKGGSLLSFDHCVVRYADDHVRDVELILD